MAVDSSKQRSRLGQDETETVTWVDSPLPGRDRLSRSQCAQLGVLVHTETPTGRQRSEWTEKGIYTRRTIWWAGN